MYNFASAVLRCQMRIHFSLLLSAIIFTAQPAYSQNYPPAAAKDANIPVGTKVYFEDTCMRYGGGMISGVIIRDRGAGFSRYTVKIDKPMEPTF